MLFVSFQAELRTFADINTIKSINGYIILYRRYWNAFCQSERNQQLDKTSGGILREKNRQYLQHDYYTDIITFDYSENDKISGDLFISLETVKSNSETFHTAYKEELHRTIIHGILHLCGINDKGPGEREIMEENENKALRLLPEEFLKDSWTFRHSITNHHIAGKENRYMGNA